MERYCIKTEEVKNTTFRNNIIKGMDFGFYKDLCFLSNRRYLFDDIEDLFSQYWNTPPEPCESNVTDYKNEYEKMLLYNYNHALIDFDIFLHIYYTYIYHAKENLYIPLKDERLDKEIQKKIQIKRKNVKNYQLKGTSQVSLPFEIKEKVEMSISKQSGNEYYQNVEIQDFCPNLVRLSYLSDAYRNIFTKVNAATATKYQYKNVLKIFNEDGKDIFFEFLNETWLIEKNFSINLALEFYFFFKNMLQDNDFKTIERTYQPIIEKIIKSVMSWHGVYSRTLIVRKLKAICEIEYQLNHCNIAKEDLLFNICEEILFKTMDILKEQYIAEEQRMYCYFQSMDIYDADKIIFKKCTELGNAFLVLDEKNNYHFLCETMKHKDLYEKALENEWDKKLYALIQKIIIES